MNTEEDFQRAIDADPSNGGLRMVFADYLDEIGDPRGPGYRALGLLGMCPSAPGTLETRLTSHGTGWSWWGNGTQTDRVTTDPAWRMPTVWRGQLGSSIGRGHWCETRRAAEDPQPSRLPNSRPRWPSESWRLSTVDSPAEESQKCS